MIRNLLVCLLALNVALLSAKTSYVKIGGSDSSDGLSWTNAFATITKALSASGNGDVIWVAKGTYYPTTGTSRNFSFSIGAGVSLYGGFVDGDNALNDRVDFGDGEANQTVLSGDIGTLGVNSDNSYRVVNAPNMWAAGGIDGFIITSGNGNTGSSNTDGVGLLVNGSFTISNCTFKNCLSGKNGGGIYLGYGTFEINNTLVNNCNAENGGGVYLNNAGGNLTFKSCGVESNSATGDAGGLYLAATTFIDASQINNNTSGGFGGGVFVPSSSSNTIRYSLVANNSSSNGGGLYISGGAMDLNNNMIVNNYASTNGAGIYFTNNGTANLANNTIANNDANSGLGGGIYSVTYSGLYALNNIFWGNSLAQISLGNSNNGLNIGYCYVQGGDGGIDDGGFSFTYEGGSFGATCVTDIEIVTETGTITKTVDFVTPTSFGLNPVSPAYNEANWDLNNLSVCIDAGTPTSGTGTTYPCFYDNAGNYEVRYNASQISDIPEICPNGLGRINATIDMGAFEVGGLVTHVEKTSQPSSAYYLQNSTVIVQPLFTGNAVLFDLSGRILEEKAMQKGQALSFNTLEKGVYIVQLISGEQMESIKFQIP